MKTIILLKSLVAAATLQSCVATAEHADFMSGVQTKTRRALYDGWEKGSQVPTLPQTRECEMNSETNKVAFRCKAETVDGAETEIQDEIEYMIQLSYKGVGVSVEYKQEIDAENVEQETETQFDIFFDQIIEYAKGSDVYESEAYDWESDTVVKTLFLLEWNDFSPVTTDESGILSHFSATDSQGIATFNFTISQANHDEHMMANNIKVDFLLNDMSWKERDDTYVALISKVESERDVEMDHDGDHSMESVMPRNAVISFQKATSTTGLVPFGKFTWAGTANVTSETVNGTVTVASKVERVADLTQTIQVVATSPPVTGNRLPGDKSSEYIAFSFTGGAAARSAKALYWDPEAGVGYATAESFSSVVGRLASFVSLVCSMIGTILIVVF